LTLAYVGDGNNILHSLMLMAPRLGVKIRYCCPPNNQPQPEIVQQCAKDTVESCPTVQDAVSGAHAVYTDVWTSMGFEGQTDEGNFAGFQVNEALMAKARPEAVFMHCMPMERGKEVSATLPDTPCSAIFAQSENRLHAQKALLLFLQGIEV
jgi:ornithine carbamoyltransferase